MAEKTIPNEPELVACEICLKEIPESAALNQEGHDYVHHFCGLDCLEKWREKHARGETTGQ